jgi:hypothetical protein
VLIACGLRLPTTIRGIGLLGCRESHPRLCPPLLREFHARLSPRLLQVTGAFFREDGSYATPTDVGLGDLAPADEFGVQLAGGPSVMPPARGERPAGDGDGDGDGEEGVGVHTSLLRRWCVTRLTSDWAAERRERRGQLWVTH